MMTDNWRNVAKFFLSGQYKDQFKAQADKLVVRSINQLSQKRVPIPTSYFVDSES